MDFTETVILRLYAIMLSNAGYACAGQYKPYDNDIIEEDSSGRRRIRFHPTSAADTPEGMQQLILAYRQARDDANINQLLLIPCVILDFLCIHPFRDGNGRLSRLLSLFLLYRNGFDAGKYISFEEQINLRMGNYYEALKRSSDGWHENQNDYSFFIMEFLTTVSKSDILKILPDVSATTVETVLGQMVKSGQIQKIGSGRATRYIRK